MPEYPMICDACSRRKSVVGSMADPPGSARCTCGARMRRDWHAQTVRAPSEFCPYEAASGGAFAHEMAAARREGDYWYVADAGAPDGRRCLNPHGEKLNPRTGDVLIGSRAERAEYLRRNNLIDRRELGNIQEHRERIQRERRVAREKRLREISERLGGRVRLEVRGQGWGR